jgi:hypothetical protein
MVSTLMQAESVYETADAGATCRVVRIVRLPLKPTLVPGKRRRRARHEGVMQLHEEHKGEVRQEHKGEVRQEHKGEVRQGAGHAG